MLTITPEALSVIRRVTAHPVLEATSGLRIARRRDPSAPLAVGVVRRPHPRDELLERRGGRLYLDPQAAPAVDGRELDAVTDPSGRVQFVLRDAG